jgi:hypothetical protein
LIVRSGASGSYLQHLEVCISSEGAPAAQCLVEHYAEGEDIEGGLVADINVLSNWVVGIGATAKSSTEFKPGSSWLPGND